MNLSPLALPCSRVFLGLGFMFSAGVEHEYGSRSPLAKERVGQHLGLVVYCVVVWVSHTCGGGGGVRQSLCIIPHPFLGH